MEINKFNQTMKYLTRPAERPGQSLEDLTVTTDLPEEGMEFQSVIEGFGEGLDRNERKNFKKGGRTVMRPTQEAYKGSIQEIKDFVAAKKAAGEEIFHEDLLKLTGKKKVSDNVYKLKAAGVLKDITKLAQEGRGPVQKKVQKLVDELVDDVYTGKRPIIDLKQEFANKEISEKTGLKKVGKGRLGKYFRKNKKYRQMYDKKIKGSNSSIVESIIQSIAKQEGELKERLEKLTYPNVIEMKDDIIAKARPRLPQPKGVEDSILRDLRRYAVQNKNKGSLFQITKDSKSYNQLKIFDAEAGETLDKGKIIKYIKQNDPRFQEYVQTFKDVRKIKNKKYGDGTLNDALKKIKRGGVDASIQLGHVDTVGVNPLRNLEPQLKFANLAAVKKGADFKKLGLQAPRGEGGIPRKLTAEENITRFVKFADRTLKTPKPGTKFYSGLAALPEMARLGGEVITQDIPKASSVVARGLDNLRLLRPIAYETGFGAAVAPFDFVEGRPISEILLDIPTLGIAGQSLRAERLRQTVGPEVFDKIQEQRAARSEGVGGIESAMFEDFGVDETPLEEAIQARADREAEVAKTRKIQDVSEMDIVGLPNFALGGRVDFKDGGMGRRSFLKLVGGLASLPVLGRFFKFVEPATKKVLENAPTGTPDWFAPLVEKIAKEGIDISDKAAMIERQTVKELKTPDGTYTLTQTPDTGEVTVSVDTLAGVNDGAVDFVMTPNRVTDITKDGKPIVDRGEFNIVETRAEGRVVSPDGDYDIEPGEYVTNSLDDAASDWHSVEKFATGKTDEIAQQKKQAEKEFIEKNPTEDIINRYGDYDPPEPELDYD